MPTTLLARMTRRTGPVTNLAPHETVALFPSLGHLDPSQRHWHVQVHGEIYSSGQVGLGKRLLLKLLQRAMKASDAALQTDLFRGRIARFLANDCSGRRIAVRLGDDVHVLTKRSRRNGHFFGMVRLPVEAAAPRASVSSAAGLCGDARRMTLAVQHPTTGMAVAQGEVFLLPAEGVSVISDIDDTLKHSYVACKQTLLANTFLREFEPIEGMAELFRQWAIGGAAFHYVSSSPWQLYRHLSDHLSQQGFPDGSYHLRAFRLRDHLLRRILMLRRSGKAAVIRGILQTFPQRKFVLLGDSGEADPEIYGVMARKFPRQVAGVYIRQIPGPRDTQARYGRAFRGVRYDAVRLFREAAELAEVRVHP
jgi:phosphatidate phosphatase APP1